ncbi:MAG: hypothetical protein M3093_01505, partial [Thermoproteota archaeon]|nr:hypothetical protein [Thermoproteota archaeon]
MLPKNNNKKEKMSLALVFTVLSMSIISSLLIIASAPAYAGPQANGSQNATTVGDIPSTTMGMDANSTLTTDRGNQSISEIRSLIDQIRVTLQNGDIPGALMNLNSALDAIGGAGDENHTNVTAAPNKMTDDTPITIEAGTIGSGGAGGAGTAGGIITGNETTT